MFNKMRTLVASAVIGLAAIAAVPAQAGGVYFTLGNSGQVAGGVVTSDVEQVHHRRWHRHGPVYGRWHRPAPIYRGCSQGDAVRKAWRMGLRRAHVVRMNGRVIVVQGRNYRGPDRVAFARAPGCPIVRY